MTLLFQRQIIHSAVTGLTSALPVLLLQCSLQAGDAGTPATADPGETGVIAGTVTYHPDPDRPWRYARYYVEDRRTGALAEAVVALSSRSLRGLNPPDEPTVRDMDQKDYRFDPETMVIRAGDSVRFTNGDPTVHNVRTADGFHPFNVNVATGAEYVQEFDRASGMRQPIRIGCVLHSTMRAWIYVFDHPFYTLTEQDGAYRYEGVPPGKYTLQLTHPAGELSWSRDVTIEPGSELQLDIELSPDNLTTRKDN